MKSFSCEHNDEITSAVLGSVWVWRGDAFPWYSLPPLTLCFIMLYLLYCMVPLGIITMSPSNRKIYRRVMLSHSIHSPLLHYIYLFILHWMVLLGIIKMSPANRKIVRHHYCALHNVTSHDLTSTNCLSPLPPCKTATYVYCIEIELFCRVVWFVLVQYLRLFPQFC